MTGFGVPLLIIFQASCIRGLKKKGSPSRKLGIAKDAGRILEELLGASFQLSSRKSFSALLRAAGAASHEPKLVWNAMAHLKKTQGKLQRAECETDDDEASPGNIDEILKENREKAEQNHSVASNSSSSSSSSTVACSNPSSTSFSTSAKSGSASSSSISSSAAPHTTDRPIVRNPGKRLFSAPEDGSQGDIIISKRARQDD